MNTRIAYIDLLRAYAIFLVTGFHLWRYFGKPSQEYAYYDLYALFEKGFAGVELFFVISGFSMALITYKGIDTTKQIDWKNYLLKRIWRIVPAYYTAIVLWSILIYYGVAPKPIAIIDQLSHLLFVHTFNPQTYYSISGVFWSLGIEMQFYFLLPLILGAIIRFPLLVLVFALLPLLYNNIFSASFLFTSTVFAFFIYFIIGYILYIYKEKLYERLYAHKYSRWVVVAFFALFLHITFYKDTIVNVQVTVFLWTLGILPLIIYLTQNRWLETTQNKVLRFFIFTGTASYSIYLYNYIFYIDKKPFAHNVEALIFYTFLIYTAGIVMYYLIELPSQKLRKNYLKKDRDAS